MKRFQLMFPFVLILSASAQLPYGKILEKLEDVEAKATTLSDLEQELLEIDKEVQVKYEYQKTLTTGQYRFAGYLTLTELSEGEKLEFVTYHGETIPTKSFGNPTLEKELLAKVKEGGALPGIITVNLFYSNMLSGEKKVKESSISKVYSFAAESVEKIAQGAEEKKFTAEHSKKFKAKVAAK